MVFFGDGGGVSPSISRPADDLKGTQRGVFLGRSVLTMLTVESRRVTSSSRNVTVTQSMSDATIRCMICFERNSASFNVVDRKLSFMMRILWSVACSRIE